MRFQSTLKLFSTIKRYPLIISNKQNNYKSKQTNIKRKHNKRYHNLSFLNNIKNGVVIVSTCVLIASSNLYLEPENVLAVTSGINEKMNMSWNRDKIELLIDEELINRVNKLSDNEILDLLQDLIQTSNKNVLFNIKNKEINKMKIDDSSIKKDNEEINNIYNEKIETLNFGDEEVDDVMNERNDKNDYKDITNELIQKRKPENIINKPIFEEDDNDVILNIKNKIKNFDFKSIIKNNIIIKEEYIRVFISILLGLGLIWVLKALLSYIFVEEEEEVKEIDNKDNNEIKQTNGGIFKLLPFLNESKEISDESTKEYHETQSEDNNKVLWRRNENKNDIIEDDVLYDVEWDMASSTSSENSQEKLYKAGFIKNEEIKDYLKDPWIKEKKEFKNEVNVDELKNNESNKDVVYSNVDDNENIYLPNLLLRMFRKQ